MNKTSNFIIVVIVLTVVLPTQLLSEVRERADVPVKNTWNLKDLYHSEESWSKSTQKLVAQFDEVLAYKGKLAGSASQLLACLEFNSRLSKEFDRLYSYASMKSDQDTRKSKPLGLKQQLEQRIIDYISKASFIEPEIAGMDKQKIDDFIAKKPKLKIYKMYLYDILRTKAHRLSEKEEKILAETSLLANSPGAIYRILSNAELPYPEVELSDGTRVTLNKAGYSRYRAVTNREDREKVFNAFWKTFYDFKQTFGVQLYSNIKKDMFYARVRNYNSSLERALDRYNIPTEVYSTLIENVHNNLDTFHRYLKLKKLMLGVDQLKYSDLYAPVVKGIDLKYTFEEAKELVLDSVKPLGKDYTKVVNRCFENRWIDVYPNLGKRSGAYSNGSAYDVHPYILLNYNGKYDDVSTLTHELGHTMHSYYSNKTQPYPTADYSIFVAEVASTFNEALLINKMLSEIKDEDTRLSLLMDYLEGIRQTVFRQTQFAEFELRIHEIAERAEPLTDESLNRLYGDILKKYYGHDKRICHIDQAYTVEWAYIPHFYYNFYVYQYATSFTASTALVEEVLNNENRAAEKYIEFLSSGGADYPINLLKKAGIDMTTPEPFDKTMAAMNRTIDEIERILEKRKLSDRQKQ
ncbi:MAG: oligoendopeptidase F [Planctomycetota bacterium]|jgi:oligoendopeptidase F